MKSFEAIACEMQRLRMPFPNPKIEICIPDAETILRQALTYFLNIENLQMQWLPEYWHIVDWMSDNKGRGLFLYGNCGRGKSLLCRYVLPAILLGYCNRVVSVFDIHQMNGRLDYVLTRGVISLDDIGTEDISNIYGNRRLAFAEIMDATEKYNKLIIVSTNLSVDEIRKRYGERILDRILSTTQRVLFSGESFRK